MGQAVDEVDDGRTWQPTFGQGGPRPEDLPTRRAGRPGEDDESTPAPDVTDARPTLPAGEVAHVPEDGSGSRPSEADPERTPARTTRSSGEWDATPPPTFEVGAVVFDKYRLLERIGVGGMGEVWRVWHISLETERALKLIKAELAQNDKGWRRFQREARVMAKIRHPNAVAVYDFRRAQSVGYIEMEFVRGRSLARILEERHGRPMPLDRTARVLEQLCDVLQEAHGHRDEETGESRPIIHRDIKPSNLMLVGHDDDGPPRLKVLDFGIAKIAEDEGTPEVTAADDIVGTPAYMSPEQIRGGLGRDGGLPDVDARSDLYSTGIVLYHLLTGTIPFLGGRMALLAAHLHDPPMPMKEANPEAAVPPEVERVVLQCLEKDPGRRPQTAGELRDRFLRAAGRGTAAPRLASEGAARRRMAAAAAAIATLAVVGLGATMLARGTRRPSNVTAPDPRGTAGGVARGPAEPASRRADGLWEPRGYAVLDAEEIVPDHPGYAANLERLDDGVIFWYLRDRVYIPAGYEPESLDDADGEGWPVALIRVGDRARFLRIQGAVYRRGDPRPGPTDAGAQGEAIAPHYVRVRGFYIQETEVTIGEMQDYAGVHPDDPDVRGWKDWLDGFRADHPDPTRYPAAHVSYRLARRFARSVAGLLPTEAQWEWAGKSRHDGYVFAWGEQPTPRGIPARARLKDPDAHEFGPAPVKQYPGDQTRQHVFDMVGNLRELCADAYVDDGAPDLAGNSRSHPLIDERRAVDPSAPGVEVVVRGGSFRYPEDKATAFFRWRESPGEIPYDVGFRVVLECTEPADGSP